MEMTFMDQDAIMGLVEALVAHVFQQVWGPKTGRNLLSKFPDTNPNYEP